MSLYVFHPLTLIPILAQWNSNSKESQTLGLLAVDENLLFLEYVCNCNANVGFVSIYKKTKTEWVDSNHDVIVSDIGSGTCLPPFGVSVPDLQ